ncbi:N,N-dimethylformamidase beta subunit family domain-containing protein [Epibacterium sp. Ofav1-8]|uniref:N,N-dimethylformamidase beta subunit family domain-containing protein n=1 Tax=Epibacterium sp. Ofav1-8 TaxID=2917735 RepID=UPI001EF50179|nr:N,N-dimethylformamidase beta subunit family domain-containing protein [Epibacterium sp. Ofav1-8]MCG7625086.1 hypothetical protein [Epibacterium sp. Ofav1-8]
MQVTGYIPDWSVKAGAPFTVHAASVSGLVYLHLRQHLGPVSTPCDWPQTSKAVTDVQALRCDQTELSVPSGSWFEVRIGSALEAGFELGFDLRLPASGAACGGIAALIGGSAGLRMSITDRFTPVLEWIEDERVVAAQEVDLRLDPMRWNRCTLGLRNDALEVRVLGPEGQGAAFDMALSVPTARLDRLILGALPGWPASRCRIGHPVLHDAMGRELACWDLARAAAHPMAVSDRQLGAFDGWLHGAPRRAVPARGWTGEHVPGTAPEQFNAVDLSGDDLEDAGWPVLTTLTAPEETGVYSAILSTGPEVNWADRESFDALPLFVTPGAATGARVALVMPTFSYRAYANNSFWQPEDPEQFPQAGPTQSAPLYEAAAQMGLKSLYCQHGDGSGVALASARRPQLTVRADFHSQLLGMPHQFAADLAILDWLRVSGTAFDVLTDECLDDETADVLAGYDVAITGSHPEYCTRASLGAYDRHRQRGGSILYAGGNGFYWRIARAPQAPHLIEVARREGVRTWDAEPGEACHALDGRPGGLSRNFAPAPEAIFGNSFCAMGFSGDGSYQRAPDLDSGSLPPRIAQVLADLGDAPFGVAGLELDGVRPQGFRAGRRHVLAQAVELPAGYVPAIEDFPSLDGFSTGAEAKLRAAVRGQIVLVEHAAGGLGLSIGSIRWAEGLRDSGDRRSCAALLTAALHDMLERSGHRTTKTQKTTEQEPTRRSLDDGSGGKSP